MSKRQPFPVIDLDKAPMSRSTRPDGSTGSPTVRATLPGDVSPSFRSPTVPVDTLRQRIPHFSFPMATLCPSPATFSHHSVPQQCPLTPFGNAFPTFRSPRVHDDAPRSLSLSKRLPNRLSNRPDGSAGSPTRRSESLCNSQAREDG